MARPKKPPDQLKSRHVNFWITEADYHRAEQESRKLNLPSVNEYGRACFQNKRLRVIFEEGHDPEKVHQIRHIGVNCNQAVRRLNELQPCAPAELAPMLERVLAELADAHALIRDFVLREIRGPGHGAKS